MFLTAEQLVELTHYRQPSRQRAALTQMGVPFRVRPDGTLAVARAVFDSDPKSRATMHSGTPSLRITRHGTSKVRQ